MLNEYHFDKLIVGGSLESLIYSYYNDADILLLNPLYPFELSTIEYLDGFRSLGYDNKAVIYKSELWDRLTFILSMTDNNKRIIINYQEVQQFDEIKNNSFSVYDWFNVRSGNNHQNKKIEDKEGDFVKNIYFYTAKRIGGNRTIKDLVAESFLTKEQIGDVNYTEGISRLKVLKMMKSAGIRGQSNGTNKSGIRQHYALKIEHTHRQIISNYSSLFTIEDIISLDLKRGEQWNLMKKLFRHKQISTLRGSFQLPASL